MIDRMIKAIIYIMGEFSVYSGCVGVYLFGSEVWVRIIMASYLEEIKDIIKRYFPKISKEKLKEITDDIVEFIRSVNFR